ncbi:hypothetical protein [Mycolicibacterium tusciae]|uniref:hypothetical protein n=1 Tax=Mycolicibacterium tusciae TaxID=75922 RepID=UPI00024A4371|nr:hypothetical protein [Mycolicibacterium tusciae]
MRLLAVWIGILLGACVVLVGVLMAGMRWQVGPVVNTTIGHVGRNSGRIALPDGADLIP